MGAHPDIARHAAHRANRGGHLCRECADPTCVGEQRSRHEVEFACAESSSLLPQADYFACPGCGCDIRTAPACRAPRKAAA